MTGAAFSLRRSPQLAFVCGLLAVMPLGAFYSQARDAAQPAIAAWTAAVGEELVSAARAAVAKAAK